MQPRIQFLNLRYLEPPGAGVHVFAGFFVLLLVLVIVLEEARSSTSTIRPGRIESEQDKTPRVRNFKTSNRGPSRFATSM
jgi:hypothetical protein